MIISITNDNISKTIKFHSIRIIHGCCYYGCSIISTRKPSLNSIISIIHYIKITKWIKGDGRWTAQLIRPWTCTACRASNCHTQWWTFSEKKTFQIEFLWKFDIKFTKIPSLNSMISRICNKYRCGSDLNSPWTTQFISGRTLTITTGNL